MKVSYGDRLFARGAMVARQVLTLKIEVRVLAGEPPVVYLRIASVSTDLFVSK